MLRNYFAVTGLDVAKHKSYALINAVGLALGIGACIAIFLVTDYKFGFDKFDSNGNCIYHILSSTQNSARSIEFPNSEVSTTRALKHRARSFELKAGLIVDSWSTGSPGEPSEKFDHNLCNLGR